MAKNRNRTAGHNYERQVVNEIKNIGFNNILTARSESRNADNAGIDIFDPSGDFPFYIQNKVYKGYPKLNELINNDRPTRWKDKNIIVFHKKVSKKGKRFYTDDEFVSMKKEDFYELLNRAYGNRHNSKHS